MDAQIVGMTDDQLPRSTTQKFAFTLTDSAGTVIDPAQAEISYQLSQEGIVTIDAQNHTLRTVADGTVSITVSAAYGGATVTDALEITVCGEGGNLIDAASSSFESGTFGRWYNYAEPGDPEAFLYSEIGEEDGNKAMRMFTNPAKDFVTGTGSTVLFKAGYYVKAQPGKLYEISYRIKIDDYTMPEDAVSFLRLLLQVYAYGSTYGGTSIALTSIDADASVLGEWVEVRLPVYTPADYDADIYLMPRYSVRPNFSTDNSQAGWGLSAWLDDFQIREVGVASLKISYATEPTADSPEGTVVLRPVTTTDAVIGLASDWNGEATLASSNEDVIQVTGDVERYTEDGYDFAAFDVQLVGLNDEAELTATQKIGDETATSSITVTASGIEETIRDLTLTLDHAESLLLQRGDVAQGAFSGRTTQLRPILPEEFETVYFKSSDPSVATVDTETDVVKAVVEGTATVTASLGVGEEVLTASMQIHVVSNDRLAADQIIIAFDEGRIVGYEDLTLEADGYCVDLEKTTGGTKNIKLDAQGFIFNVEKDGQLVIDFVVKKWLVSCQRLWQADLLIRETSVMCLWMTALSIP